MIIGYWHRKNQLSVEQEDIVNNNKGMQQCGYFCLNIWKVN